MADYPLTQAGWEQIENASALWDYTQARIKTADPNKPIDIREIYQNGKQVANKEDLDANTAQINLNQTEIATNKSDIAALDGEVNANASQIQINANSIANLDTRVTTNTNDIASLQSQVTALNASSLSDVASNDSLNGDGRAIDPLSLNLANSNTWTATQTFSKAKITNPFAENASGSTNKVTSLDGDGEVTVSSDLTIGDLFATKTKTESNESDITDLDARIDAIEGNYMTTNTDQTVSNVKTFSTYLKFDTDLSLNNQADRSHSVFSLHASEATGAPAGTSERPALNVGTIDRGFQLMSKSSGYGANELYFRNFYYGTQEDWLRLLHVPLTGMPSGSGQPVLWDGTKLVVGS